MRQRVLFHGVATVIMIDKIIGLFCRILSLLQSTFAKETYNLIDPTDQSHPIVGLLSQLFEDNASCIREGGQRDGFFPKNGD